MERDALRERERERERERAAVETDLELSLEELVLIAVARALDQPLELYDLALRSTRTPSMTAIAKHMHTITDNTCSLAITLALQC